jgi:hypothetical protein
MAAKALILLPILAERDVLAGLTPLGSTPKINSSLRRPAATQLPESPAC